MSTNTSKEKFIRKIEINVINKCGMKCQGCSHFASLEKEEEIYSLDSLESDLIQLKTLGIKIKQEFKLIGGEPLLIGDKLIDFINLIRKYYNEQRIVIHTNGLLVEKMSDELIDCMDKNNVHLYISKMNGYNIDKNKINARFNKTRICCLYMDDKETFSKIFLPSGKTKNKLLQYSICTRKCCHTLRNGKLFVCSVAAFVYRLNRDFGTKYPENCFIDIYKNSAEDIIEFLRNPTELCSHCDGQRKYEQNQVKNIELSDWM